MQVGLGLCLWLDVCAAMLAFGAQGFVLGLVPDGLTRDLEPALRVIVGRAALVLCILAPAWLVLQSVVLAGTWTATIDPAVLLDVLTGTVFGRIWVVHVTLVGSLAAAIRLDAPRGVATALSGLVLASVGLTGHANLHDGLLGVLHRACLVAHLLAAGAWLGSLVPLLIVMRTPARHGTRLDVVAALRRFSTWGHAVVAVVVLTGIGNLVFVLGPPPLDGSGLYLIVLSGKLAVVTVMIGLALINRYGLVTRLGRQPTIRIWLIRLTLFNLAAGTLALLLASGLGMIDPSIEP